MAQSLTKAFTILRTVGFGDFIIRLAKYIKRQWTYFRLRFGKYDNLESRNNYISQAFTRDYDRSHLDLFKKLSRFSVNTSKIATPRYIKPQVKQILGVFGNPTADIFEYREAPDDVDLFLGHPGLLHEVQTSLIKTLANSEDLSFASNGLFVIAFKKEVLQFPLEHDENAKQKLLQLFDLVEQMKENKWIYAGPDGSMFQCHENLNDIGVINEVYNWYLQWKLNIQPTDIVVDIGAHIGSFSVMAAKKAKHVFSFEPLPENQKLILANQQLNSLNNMTMVPMAVYSEATQKTLFVDKESGVGHNLHFAMDGGEEIRVKTTTLPQVVEMAEGIIDILKVDCEGSEYQILFGQKDLLKKHVKTIIMEAEVYANHRPNDMVDFLRKCEFVVETRGGETLMLIYARNSNIS